MIQYIDGTAGKREEVYYREVWEYLVNVQHYCFDDPFVQFMIDVHDGKIEETLNEHWY